MRLVFNTELKVEVDPTNDKLRETFIKLVSQAAEQVYGSATMLSRKTPPTITLHQTSREGKKQIPLFGMKLDEDEDEDDDA